MEATQGGAIPLKRYQIQQATLLQRRGKLVTDHPEPVAAT